MSTEISNERLELIANNKIVATITDDWSMAKELLALRKQVRSAEEERNVLADVAGSNAAHIKRIQRELPTINKSSAETYGWVAEYPAVPPSIGCITYSFHDNMDDAQEEAAAYNGHVVEVIRR